MAMNFQIAKQQWLDDNGNPIAGAQAFFFDPTTTTPRLTYSDAALTIPSTLDGDGAVVADAAGRFPQIYHQIGLYKYRLVDPSGNQPNEELDNVDPGLSTAAGAIPVNAGGTGSTTAAGARSNLGAASQVAHDALELRVDDLEGLLDAPILAASNTQAYAATFTPVFTAFETRDVTLTGSITINAPTVTAGQKIRLVLIQDATGSRIATWNAAFKWPAGQTGVLSTTAAAVDVLEGYARTTGIIEVTSFKRQDVLTDIAIIEDQKTQNTAGGTFTSGADRTRDLNTEVSDLGALVTVASNQFTITNPGTYKITWSAPASVVGNHQSFLYNITAAAEVKRGTSESTTASATVATRSVGSTVVVLAASAVFEIRHRCNTTSSTSGFGPAVNFGIEVFTRVEVQKLK